MSKHKFETIGSALELWDALVERAGHDVERYDASLTAELAESIGLSVIDFRKQLAQESVAAQALLLRLLKLIAPYGFMMKEILELFAHSG